MKYLIEQYNAVETIKYYVVSLENCAPTVRHTRHHISMRDTWQQLVITYINQLRLACSNPRLTYHYSQTIWCTCNISLFFCACKFMYVYYCIIKCA